MGEAPYTSTRTAPFTACGGFVAALLLVVVAPPGAAADCSVADGAVVAVAAAVDGETVRLVDGRLVRLAGIESPRLPLGEPPGTTWPLAEAAAKALTGLTAGAFVQMAPVDAESDRYGRLHAVLTLADGRDVAETLVDEGLARVRWGPGEVACGVRLLPRERVARAANRGLWANPAYAVRAAGDSSLPRRIGLYELVEGRPVSVGRGFRMTFIDFGENHCRDFTVMVPAPLAKAMVDAGTPADDMVGRRIRVRGVIEEAGGPAIRLSDPAAIELIGDGEDDADVGR